MKNILPKRIFLVIDRKIDFTGANLYSRDLELTEDKYYNDLTSELHNLDITTSLFTSPSDFIRNHKLSCGDLALSLWSGTHSWNRRMLPPAIFEALSVPYIGADAYTAAICQDKALAKKLAYSCGIATPPSIIVHRLGTISGPIDFPGPFVVKPLLEGGSIGIGNANKIQTVNDAMALAQHLQMEFDQPIIIEQFVPGREINICTIHTNKNTIFLEAVEVILYQNPNYLKNRIYGFEDKKKKNSMEMYNVVTNELSSNVLLSIRNLMNRLGKIDYMRIDGRLKDDGSFVLIELSPDVHLGKSGSFANAYCLTRGSYLDLLHDLLTLHPPFQED